MKIIFLDIDGVLRSGIHIKTPFPKFSQFDSKCVKILNEILNITNSEIVLSSDWRLRCTLEEIQQFFKFQNVCKVPISFTKELKTFNSELYKKLESPFWDLENIRISEIQEFIFSDLFEIESFVVVDDLFLGKQQFKNNELIFKNENGFEEFIHIDSSKGLTKLNGIDIIKKLNEN